MMALRAQTAFMSETKFRISASNQANVARVSKSVRITRVLSTGSGMNMTLESRARVKQSAFRRKKLSQPPKCGLKLTPQMFCGANFRVIHWDLIA